MCDFWEIDRFFLVLLLILFILYSILVEQLRNGFPLQAQIHSTCSPHKAGREFILRSCDQTGFSDLLLLLLGCHVGEHSLLLGKIESSI